MKFKSSLCRGGRLNGTPKLNVYGLEVADLEFFVICIVNEWQCKLWSAAIKEFQKNIVLLIAISKGLRQAEIEFTMPDLKGYAELFPSGNEHDILETYELSLALLAAGGYKQVAMTEVAVSNPNGTQRFSYPNYTYRL